jgi:MOSC domain-containing protein YiiM
MEQRGRLLSIAVRAKSRAPMQELGQGEMSLEHGVLGDFRGTPGKRQVTVLAVEDWRAACSELRRNLPWTHRRANLLVEGLALNQSTDATIRIGDVVLRVTGETTPCSRMEEAAAGLYNALLPRWRGGVCCRVEAGGTIAAGDEVVLILAGEDRRQPSHEGE